MIKYQISIKNSKVNISSNISNFCEKPKTVRFSSKIGHNNASHLLPTPRTSNSWEIDIDIGPINRNDAYVSGEARRTRFPVKSRDQTFTLPVEQQKGSLRRSSSSCSSCSSSFSSLQRGGADSLARELESLLRNIPGSFTSTVIRIDSWPRSIVNGNVLFAWKTSIFSYFLLNSRLSIEDLWNYNSWLSIENLWNYKNWLFIATVDNLSKICGITPIGLSIWIFVKLQESIVLRYNDRLSAENLWNLKSNKCFLHFISYCGIDTKKMEESGEPWIYTI